MSREIEVHSDEWHARRREGIGGSDVASMFGLSKFTSPEQLWESKAGLLPPSDAGDAAARGTMMEPHVVARARGAGVNVVDAEEFVRHPRWDEGVKLQANTDGMVGELAIFEAKTANEGGYIASRYLNHEVPLSHWLQTQMYLACTGRDFVYAACVIGPKDNRAWTPECGQLVVLTALRDHWVIGAIEAMGARFMAAVESGTRPSYQTHELAGRITARHRAQFFGLRYLEPMEEVA